jgi:spoIIIJ-associated protein
MSNKEVRIEAKTIEAAVVMACVKLGVTQDNIEYEVLKQPKTGLMSIFGGKAEIKAWARNSGGRQGAQAQRDRGHDQNRHGQRRDARGPREDGRNGQGHHQGQQGNGQGNGHGNTQGRRGPQKSRSHNRDQNQSDRPRFNTNQERTPREERVPAEPLAPEVLAQVELEIREFCKDLCEKIVGEPVKVSSTMTEDRMQVEVDNAAIAQMIQEQSKFVESLEHLLRKKPRHLKQDLPFRIFIDAQGSRKGRELEIGKVAKEHADQVASTGQKVVLDYKSAADRKIVHMTLEGDERVYTKSIGSGSGRKLLILPSRGKRPSQATNEESDNV